MIKKLGRNDHCWCGSGKKYKACHEAFDDKLRYLEDIGHIVPSHKLIKTPEQIEKIKESARINVEGFPKSVCTSINEQVCHGFPSKDVILKSGDIVNVDCSTILHGYFSDSSRMFCIGDVKPEVKKLVDVTKECVELGLEQVKPWGFLGDMGQAVHDHAYANGYTVVREIGGHGVGLEFHEDPWVGYNTRKGTDMVMAPGMMFTIEPMVNMGKVNVVTDEKNGWEVSTADGLPSAQWEIQVLVTEDGHEVISW